MTTIPARLAQRTQISRNFSEAQARSRALYRDWYRAAPEISSLYALNVPPSTLRAKFRTWFERNRNVKDIAVIDLMLFKSQAELQETLNAWKQIPHIMNWFKEEEVRRGAEGAIQRDGSVLLTLRHTRLLCHFFPLLAWSATVCT